MNMDSGAPLHHNLNQSHHGNGYDMTLMGPNMDVTRSKVKTKETPGLDKLIDRMHTGLDVSGIQISILPLPFSVNLA